MANQSKSYIRNCTINTRGEVLFSFDRNGDVSSVTLDGYAVIPIEEYEKLKTHYDTGTKNT